MLDAGPQQWPLGGPAKRTGRARLYEDGVFPTPTAARASPTPSTKPVAEPREATLPLFAEHRPAARPVARHEPHRHGRAGCSGTCPSPSVQMNAQDMARSASSSEGDLVHLTSRRGSILLPARASEEVAD